MRDIMNTVDLPGIIGNWLSLTKQRNAWYIKRAAIHEDRWYLSMDIKKTGELGEENKTLRSFEVGWDKLTFLGNSPAIPKTMVAADPQFFDKLSYILSLIESMEL